MGLAQVASRTFIIKLGSTAIGFVGLVSFIRILGPEIYGSLVLFQGIIGLVAILVSLGLDMALEKRVSGRKEGSFLPTALLIKGSLFIPCAFLFWEFQISVNNYLGATLTDILIPALLVYMLGRTLLHSLRGELRVMEAEVIQVGQRIIFVGGGIIAALNSYGLRTLVLVFTGSWIFVLILTIYRSREFKGLPSLNAAYSLFSYMRHSAVIVSLSGPVYSWADTLIIGLFLSPTAVTAYESAWRVTRAVGLLSTSVSTALFPQISNSVESMDKEQLKETVSKGFILSTLLVLPATAGATVVGRQILVVLFDPALEIASTALVIILIGRLFESLNDVVGPVLSGMDYPNLIARAAVAQLTLGVLLNFVLIPILGITGGAIATATSLAAAAILDVRYLERFIDVPLPISTLVYSGFVSGLMAVIVFVVLQIWPEPGIFRITGAIATGVVVYGALISVNPKVVRVVREGLSQ